MTFRPMAVATALLLGAVACGDDDKSEECPEPTQTIAAPDEVGPDLSLVPECKLPDTQTMLAPGAR
ncbi:MAG TPA: hypothetical protein VJQ44_14100 [Gemmatimonadales bacterium]|nr:hypothetical protein [Gemmatimonadales bacterium]